MGIFVHYILVACGEWTTNAIVSYFDLRVMQSKSCLAAYTPANSVLS
jgi:hypothetical protein